MLIRNKQITYSPVEGRANFKMKIENSGDPPPGHTKIQIDEQSIEPKEIVVLKKRFYIKGSDGIKREFDNKNTIDLPTSDNVEFYFDHQLVGNIIKGVFTQPEVPLSLPETRAIADINDSLTSNSEETEQIRQIYSHGNKEHDSKCNDEKCNHEHDGKRIDAHTHYVAAFQMKAALEKAMAIHEKDNKKVLIPTLVVLKILKEKGLINSNNHADWMQFFEKNNVAPPDGKDQKNNSKDLIAEDFAIFIKKLEREKQTEELKHCISKKKEGEVAAHLDLRALKQKLDRQGEGNWEMFCKGFDLSAAHACDFTEHMETAYGLRNWFGKDEHFMRAQLETIYEEYEQNGIDYAELPAGPFKNPLVLEEFIKVSREIEHERAMQGKRPINLRPGLSIARLIDPASFRTNLFSYAELVIKYPEIASVSLLAHETNPTTEHFLAIQDFVAFVNQYRPGFTVELHAGEMATHGHANIREARHFAKTNTSTLIRAGHAIYGSHRSEPLDNFIEEKCPLSNATLIRVEPDVDVEILLGIAEGRSKIFWGSDGVLYNPLYGPDRQKEFFTQCIADQHVQAELERRFKNPESVMNRFGATHFEGYKKELFNNYMKSLSDNEKNEDSYIHYKKCEKDCQELKLNLAMLINIYGDDRPKEISELINSMDQLINKINQQIKDTPGAPYSAIRAQLINHHDAILGLNNQLNELCKQGKLKGKNKQVILSLQHLSKIRRECAFQQLEPFVLKQRAAVDSLNKLLKLNKVDAGKKISPELKQILNDVEKEFKNANEVFSDAELAAIVAAILPNKDKIKKEFDRLATEVSTVPGDLRCERFLDPNHDANLQMKKYHKENDVLLKKYEKKEDMLKDAVVLFGSPESVLPPEDQKYYMEELYKNIYKILKEGLNNHQPIVLLGGINEGINPLVYKILNEKHDELKGCMPTHVVASDEDFFHALTVGNHKATLGERSNTTANGVTVPYLLAEKKREEIHIGYADFIAFRCQGERSKVIQLGGEQSLWYDTNVIINDRFRESGRKILYFQSSYEVPGIKGSAQFAKGCNLSDAKESQAFNYASQVTMNINGDDLLHLHHLQHASKATSHTRNLNYTYRALKTAFVHSYNLCIDDYKAVKDSKRSKFINHEVFMQAYSGLEDEKTMLAKIEVNKFFADLILNIAENPRRSKILETMTKILDPVKGFATGLLMGERNFDILSIIKNLQTGNDGIINLLNTIKSYDSRSQRENSELVDMIRDKVLRGEVTTPEKLREEMGLGIDRVISASQELKQETQKVSEQNGGLPSP